MRDLILTSDDLAALVLDCGGVDFMDSQGSGQLGEILRLAEESGVTLRLARVKPEVRLVLERDGVLDRLGRDKVHGNVFRAVEAHRDRADG